MADAVYGNLAHNGASAERAYGRSAQPERVRRPAPQERTAERQRVEEQRRVSTRTAARTAPKQGVSMFAAIGTLCVALLFVLVLFSNIQLTQLSDESVVLHEELDKLVAEEAKLLVRYESAFDLNEVERYATMELGMVKADSDQIRYIQRESEDKVVIVSEDAISKGILGSVSELLSRLASYFTGMQA